MHGFTMFSGKKLIVQVFAGRYLPGYKGGGPIKTIKNLFEQTGENISFKLITNDRDLDDTTAYAQICYDEWNDVGNAQVFYSRPGLSELFKFSQILREKRYDLVYLNSFFSMRFSFIPLLISKVLRQRIILGPRGEFSEGALSLKRYKKRIYIAFYKLLGLHRGTVFQASSDYEARDIHRILGPKADVFVAENIGSAEFAERINRRGSSSLKAVFVSRISPKKNLLAALDVLKSVREPVEYDIYGPIEDREYWAECLAVIETLPPKIKVEHKGELYPEQVVSTISSYDLFFMPTKGENYAHVIAEALCAGLPLLIADTTPWRDLQEKGLGWDLPLDNPKAFASAVDELSAMSPEEHLNMRENVLAWAKHKFAKQDAIEANIAMFRYAYEKKH